MRVIMLMYDSLNRNFLSPYGCDWTHTPNFARLAEKTVQFNRSYVGSLPCMPARRELHTGRYNFLHRSWGPIEPFDDSMPEILKNNGIHSHLISDHEHYWEDGGGTYHTRYSTWEIVRGQEGDRWKAVVNPPEKPPFKGVLWDQDWVNRMYMDCEEKQPQTVTFNLGMEFLKTNLEADNWFLHLETFDPHEPFYVMEQYRKLYDDPYQGPLFDRPMYGKVHEQPGEIQHIRSQYAALLSMCDHNLGCLLDFMDAHDMWKDTMLIVNTDHGFLLSEHDCWAKCCHPFYEEVSHTPLFIWDPRSGRKGVTRESLVQTIDLAPTILEFFGLPIPKDMQGKALRGVIEDDTPVREAALFGMHGQQMNVTDGRYVYMRDPNEINQPLYDYTLMPTHMRRFFYASEMQGAEMVGPLPFTKTYPVMRLHGLHSIDFKVIEGKPIKYGTRLFDLKNDPEEAHPLEDAALEERMKGLMRKLLIESDAPAEQFVRMDV